MARYLFNLCNCYFAINNSYPQLVGTAADDHQRRFGALLWDKYFQDEFIIYVFGGDDNYNFYELGGDFINHGNARHSCCNSKAINQIARINGAYVSDFGHRR